MQALEHDKANDIMFWASSYNLFVTWAANGQHPWDNLPGSHAPSATLEIGAFRGHPTKVIWAGPLLSSVQQLQVAMRYGSQRYRAASLVTFVVTPGKALGSSPGCLPLNIV